MAKKREGKHDEVMLIPFLDILCSLIGILILIIVVVCVAQMQKVQGRTKQDIQMAQKYQSLLLHQKELEKTAARLKAKVAELEKLRKELEAKQQKLVELRKRLSLSADAARDNKQTATKLQKEVEDLIAQIEAIAKTIPPLQAEIEQLKKLLAERQKKPDEKPPSVVIRPSGSGARQANQRLFFVEATGAGVVLHKSKTELVRVAKESVGVDKDYNALLKTVKNAGNATLIFLIRKDGWSTYTRAAGWAEQGFDLNTGKLPIPGDGTVDLSLFEKP